MDAGWGPPLATHLLFALSGRQTLPLWASSIGGDAYVTSLDAPGKPEAVATASVDRPAGAFSQGAAPLLQAAVVLKATANAKQQSAPANSARCYAAGCSHSYPPRTAPLRTISDSGMRSAAMRSGAVASRQKGAASAATNAGSETALSGHNQPRARGPDPRARTKASLCPRAAAHLLFAKGAHLRGAVGPGAVTGTVPAPSFRGCGSRRRPCWQADLR